MAVGDGAAISMPGVPGIELALICLGELNAPLRVVGWWLGRGSGVHAGRSLPLLRKRHWRSSCVATYLRVIIWGSSYSTGF